MRYNVYSQNFKRVEMKYNNSIRRKDFSNDCILYYILKHSTNKNEKKNRYISFR